MVRNKNTLEILKHTKQKKYMCRRGSPEPSVSYQTSLAFFSFIIILLFLSAGGCYWSAKPEPIDIDRHKVNPQWEIDNANFQKTRLGNCIAELKDDFLTQLFKGLPEPENKQKRACEDFCEHMAKGVCEGIITKSEAVLSIIETHNVLAEQAKLKLINTYYEIAKKMPYNEAILFLNDLPELTDEQRFGLIFRRKLQEEVAPRIPE